MIVEYAKVLAYCDKEHSLEIEQIHQSLESWIKETTGHDWEYSSDGYVEFCTRLSSQYLQLDHYPVHEISEISYFTAGIQIKNTSEDARNAHVSIDSDSLDLTVDGGTNAMTASEAFAIYTTLSALITQINAEGKGWSAAIYDSTYNTWPSSCLVEVQNHRCGAVRGIAPSYSYLDILQPYDGYTCDKETGIVERSGGWASGDRSIVAKYTAYYTVPEDIKGAVLNGVKFLMTQYDYDTEGLERFSTADLSASFEDILPGFVLDVVRLHSRVM